MKNVCLAAGCCLLISLFLPSALAEQYTAFSLKVAQERIQSGTRGTEVSQMGGITHPVGIIHDEDADDVIVVGKKIGNHAPVTLDDWAVAVRAVLQVKQDPAVSIDRTDETEKTNKQVIRFQGGLEDTQFGKDLLAADVILKRLGLDTLNADIFDVGSYLDLSITDFESSGEQSSVVSRFWFLPDTENAKVTVQEGLVIAEEYRIRVKNEIMSVGGDTERDRPAEAFAQDLYGKFQDVKLYFPELSRMEQLYYITALAQGLESSGMAKSSTISYWLDDFSVAHVPTARDYPVEENSAEASFRDTKLTIIVSGGIDFDVMLYRLQSGGIEDIKGYITKARPSPKSLSWDVPLLTCVLDTNYDPSAIDAIKEAESKKPSFGMSILRQFQPVSTPVRVPTNPTFTIPSRPLSTPIRPVSFNTQLSSARYTRTPNVGGVMLENVARVSGEDTANPLDMAGAKFSFVVDGEDARLDPLTFRKFVTALWAVYYSNEDPGISIDPIAPGAEKHLVRYIGQVINTDLGRVMREADYLMKKWAVGTETPEIKGFKSPLDYAADQGMLSVGAWSRFWFVPKDMQFRRSDNMLLFESGRMTVQTEYMFQGFGSGADPANKKFAETFTKDYQEIAKKYPVYQELFEYAKMVSLAKYLRDSGVPLFWFLMANKDLVITEDSIGTVDALVKNSKRFEGVQIEGGVELHSEGQYIYDNEAVHAISTALAKLPSRTPGTTSLAVGQTPGRTVSDPFSFTLKQRCFSVLPQHSASSSKDFRGIRYQTDFSLKEAGYQLTEKSVDQLQHQMFRVTYARLLLEASDSEGNLPGGDSDLIIEECWRKAEAASSEIVENLGGIVNKDIKSKACFLSELTKYLPTREYEDWRDVITQCAFYNTCLELVRCFRPHDTSQGAFGPGWDFMIPYQIRPLGDDTAEFRGVILPKTIALVDRMSGKQEILTFNPDRFSVAAYVPSDIKESQVVCILFLSDGSFRLLDKIENEFQFNGAGYLTDMIFSDLHQIHFEYQREFAAQLENPPYKIERASSEWVRFRSVRLPERLRVKNLEGEGSEELVFTNDQALIGYEPANPENSRFRFLALMSDLSYRLVDQNDDELVFSQSGEFQKIVCTSDKPLVQSMSSGNYSVEFGYTLNKAGEPVVAQATLAKEGQEESGIVMQYSYTADGRLGKASVMEPVQSAAHGDGLPRHDISLARVPTKSTEVQ